MSLESNRIIYEDNHLIAVNKLAGELSQGDKTGDQPLGESVKQYLKHRYQKPGNVFLGVVHRLDRPVSGVMLFARTSKALERLTKMLRDREIKKTYWAIVNWDNKLSMGRITHFLVRNPRKNITLAYDQPRKGSKEATLDYRLLMVTRGEALVEIEPLTGRQHQIRVQLAKIGASIKGDVKYGYPIPNPDESICLHARKLEFIHPVKKEPLVLEAPLPPSSAWLKFREL